MSDDKVWAFSNTGNLIHVFVDNWTDKDGVEHTDVLRAMCRGTIARHKNAVFHSAENLGNFKCKNCMKKFEAMVERADASTQPATEPKCGCGHSRVHTQASLGGDMHAIGCPLNSRTDELHAEALAMDAEETAKAEAEMGDVRWHYTGEQIRLLSQIPAAGIEGYVSAPNEDAARYKIFGNYYADLRNRDESLRLRNVRITRA